jgi:tetratricopeptide (TPR) repeat protein
VNQGEAALSGSDTVTAIKAFTGAISLKPESMLGYLKRGESYRRRNELEAALTDLRRAADLDPQATRPWELLGDVNAALKRHARAADCYQRFVALDERSAPVLYKLGLAQYSAGQWGAATQALRRALELEKEFAEAEYLLALCYRSMHKAEESLAALDRAVRLAPALLQAREALGDLYREMGRADDGISQLELLRGLDPGASREVALGLAYARAGRPQNAVLTLRAAADRYPDHPYTYVALGRVWLERAEATGDRVDLSKALSSLEAAASTDGGSEALTLFGRALLLSGENERAEAALERATEQLPADPLAFYHLADAAERQGHYRAAGRALADFHALQGDDPDPRVAAAFAARVGDLAARAGDFTVAVTWYDRALDTKEEADPDLLLRLAQAQASGGTADAARVTVTRVLEKDPSNRAAQLLLRKLQ